MFSGVLGHCSNYMAIMYNTAFLFLFSSLSLAGRLWTVLSLLGDKKKKSYRHLSWRLEVWTLDPVGLLECGRGCRSSRTAMLDDFLQCLGGFVSILESSSEVSNSSWELRRICVPFWAVCGLKSSVSSLTSALFPFLSLIGFRVKSGLLMQKKSCFFWALVHNIMISKSVMFDLM